MNEPLAEMFRQNRWANLRLLDACERLRDDQMESTVPGTRGTIRGTLMHILAGEWRYLAILTGQMPDPTINEAAAWSGVAALRASAESTGDSLITFAEGLSEEREVYRAMGGREYRGPASLILVQAFNHGTEHRSQILTILTQLGIEPPSLDGWSYGEAAGKI